MTDDWVLISTQIAQLILAGGLVWYAKVTIDESKKERKKETIEHKLENIYYPIYDLLDRSRNDTEREAIRKSDAYMGEDKYEAHEKWMFVLTQEEYGQIREMVNRFGYCLDETELGRLKSYLERTSKMGGGGGPLWVRLPTDVFDIQLGHFQSRCRELTMELERLSGMTEEKS